MVRFNPFKVAGAAAALATMAATSSAPFRPLGPPPKIDPKVAERKSKIRRKRQMERRAAEVARATKRRFVHQGKSECARRRRQIAAGQLKAENGLSR